MGTLVTFRPSPGQLAEQTAREALTPHLDELREVATRAARQAPIRIDVRPVYAAVVAAVRRLGFEETDALIAVRVEIEDTAVEVREAALCEQEGVDRWQGTRCI